MSERKRSQRAKKRNFSGVAAALKTNKDGDSHATLTCSTASSSASTSKLKQSFHVHSSTTKCSSVNNEFALVDVGVLCEFLAKHVKCDDCAGSVECLVDISQSQGYAHQFASHCSSCRSQRGLCMSSGKCSKSDMVCGKRAVLTGLYHIATTDDCPQHHMCPEGEGPWCQFASNPKGYTHKHGLSAAVVELIEPIYIDLSSTNLLSKCLHGKTQNNNECLNKLIWDRCVKEVSVGRETIEEAVYCAMGQFNDGDVSVVRQF